MVTKDSGQIVKVLGKYHNGEEFSFQSDDVSLQDEILFVHYDFNVVAIIPVRSLLYLQFVRI